MNWQIFEQLFPEGIETPDGIITANKLRRSPETGVFDAPEIECAREMIICKKDYIIGKNNEFALGINYNVYNETPHPDEFSCPLNVYGQAMLNNYLYFHPEIKI